MKKLAPILLILLFVPAVAANFEVDKVMMKAVLGPDDQTVGEFSVTNLESRDVNVDVSSSLKTARLSEQSFSLQPNEKKVVNVYFDQPSRINTFEISIEYTGFEYILPIIVELEDKEFTFDSTVEVNQTTRKIMAGEKIKAQLDFFALEDVGTQKIGVEYIIFDQINNQVISEKEEVFVSNRNIQTKEIEIPDYLGSGRYVLAVVTSYQSEFSTSTATFEVEAKPQTATFATAGIILFLIVSVLLVFFMRKTHSHVRGLAVSSRKKAEELKKNRLHAQREKLHNKIHALDDALEHGIISKSKHTKAHKHLKKKVSNINRQIGKK